MNSLSQVFAALRNKNRSQYALLAGCCFFSVLLVTAYVSMMRSPTVLSVLPEGGDSRKQVMMIFVLAVAGCGVFTTYAAGLFFRYKSRETGIFMALGASRRQLQGQLAREVALIAFGSCAAGALLGTPLAIGIWSLFRLFLVDTREMALHFDPEAYLYALAFSLFVFCMLFFLLRRFIRRTNIIDVVNEARKSEPIRAVPRWYGPVGILLLAAGGLLGYLMPTFFVTVLHWYAPDFVGAVFYLPAAVGLYMVLLHTVVNGWRRGKNRYKNIVSTSMMRFSGRQTVRNMLVITVLVAGAYFGAFYTPMLGTGSMMAYDARPVDYAFHYRADQDMLTEADIRAMAEQDGVDITGYAAQPVAILAVDGEEQVEHESAVGVTYTTEYREMLAAMPFLSESAWNALTGSALDVPPGTAAPVFHDDGSSGYVARDDVTLVTNVLTGEALPVATRQEPLLYSLLVGHMVLDDADYAAITKGLTGEWREEQVFFNIQNETDSYDFAKKLFTAIVEHSGPEVELYSGWDPVVRMRAEAAGEAYFLDNENLAAHGFTPISYTQRDSSAFRMDWKYMPQFRVLDKADFVKTTAVFLMLFIFIAIVCFAAVIVIAYTRSLTIGLTNAMVFSDLRHLGATNGYLRRTVKGQISKVFFTPMLTGTLIIFAFYLLILYFNDGGRFTPGELAGLANCLLLVAIVSAVLYGVYRLTLGKVCRMLQIHAGTKDGARAR